MSAALLRSDLVDGRDIPLAAVDRSSVVRFAWEIDSVRYSGAAAVSCVPRSAENGLPVDA
jgi:hypothetical protein